MRACVLGCYRKYNRMSNRAYGKPAETRTQKRVPIPEASDARAEGFCEEGRVHARGCPCWGRFRVKGRRHVSQSALYAHGRWTNNKESEQHMSEAGVWSANVRAFGSTHDGR